MSVPVLIGLTMALRFRKMAAPAVVDTGGVTP